MKTTSRTQTRWQIFAVIAKTPSGFKWQWRRLGGTSAATSVMFDFYFDCITNARTHGYAGPLVVGPNVPLVRSAADLTPGGDLAMKVTPLTRTPNDRGRAVAA